jgi:hypothetical protein
MPFKVLLASPPDIEGMAAQLEIDYKGGVAVPIEVFHKDGRLHVTVFPTGNDENWTFELADLMEALGRAMVRLGV